MSKKPKTREPLTPGGLTDAQWEAAAEQSRRLILIAVVRATVEEATLQIEATIPKTKIARVDRTRLLSGLREMRERLEAEVAQPGAYDRYQALSMTMVLRTPEAPKGEEASVP